MHAKEDLSTENHLKGKKKSTTECTTLPMFILEMLSGSG